MCTAQLLLNELNNRKIFYHNFENVEAEALLELQCDLYSSYFVSKGKLTRHIEIVHYKEVKECPEFSMTFTRLDNFKLHKQRKHASTAIKVNFLGLNCQVCDKSFLRRVLWQDTWERLAMMMWMVIMPLYECMIYKGIISENLIPMARLNSNVMFLRNSHSLISF